jgi:hypothetical protein
VFSMPKRTPIRFTICLAKVWYVEAVPQPGWARPWLYGFTFA